MRVLVEVPAATGAVEAMERPEEEVAVGIMPERAGVAQVARARSGTEQRALHKVLLIVVLAAVVAEVEIVVAIIWVPLGDCTVAVAVAQRLIAPKPVGLEDRVLWL